MAAITMEFFELGTEPIETLAERMTGGVLPVFYSLLWATEIASTLRDYHARGLVHGEVSTKTIRLHRDGARLQLRAESACATDVGVDIRAFGAVLYEMITGHKPPVEIGAGVFEPQSSVRTLSDVRNEAGRLAERCLTGPEDIQHVLVELRLLGLLGRGLDGGLRRVKVVSKPAAVQPERHRLRIVSRSLTATKAEDTAGKSGLQLVTGPPALRSEARRGQFGDVSNPGAVEVQDRSDSE